MYKTYSILEYPIQRKWIFMEKVRKIKGIITQFTC